MDPKKLETLQQIEAALEQLLADKKVKREDIYKQYVYLAHDYIESSDFIKARELLLNCTEEYYRNINKTIDNEEFCDIVNTIDIIFDLRYVHLKSIKE